jgi:His-Xaa-Ser system radical SAM maturase HxsC
MIPLLGRATTSNWADIAEDIWSVWHIEESSTPSRPFLMLQSASGTATDIYLSDSEAAVATRPTIHLPPKLRHIDQGDVLSISPNGRQIQVLWKATAVHNSILLTERCDNYCIMCSQPPKDRDDSYLYKRARKIVDSLPADARSVALTGGEPTVDAESFLELLHHIAAVAPELEVHVLSNGRRFADETFTRKYADVELADLMVGIPLYSSEPSLHDYIVQADGAFNETVRGILTLGEAGAKVELRVVVQQANVAVLSEIALYIVRNLPFVSQVALMGLEMTGLARPNASIVWVDPYDYEAELLSAYRILRDGGISTHIYNHPLCVIDRELWPAAVQSISDWKNDFPEVCSPCVMRDQCAGVFSTSQGRLSPHLSPIF